MILFNVINQNIINFIDIFNIWKCQTHIKFLFIFWKGFHHTGSLPWDRMFIFIIQHSSLFILASFLFKFWPGTFWLLYTFQTLSIISSLPLGITDYFIICPYQILILSYSFRGIIAVFLTITFWIKLCNFLHTFIVFS